MLIFANRSRMFQTLLFPIPGKKTATGRSPSALCHGLWMALWLGLMLGGAMARAQQPGQTAPPQKLNWQSLSAEEASKGLPVEFEGTVLCYDLGWGQLYFHDGLNAIYLSPRGFTNPFEVGQRVGINGITSWNGTAPILTNTTAKVLGRQSLPPASPVKLGDLAGSVGQWVEVRGRVRVAEASRERVTLMLKDGEQRCLVYVMNTTSTNQFKQMADAEVKIQGINASRTHDGKLDAAILFCPGLDQVSVITPGSDDRWKLPVTPIDNLLSSQPDSLANKPVHINGLVSDYEPGVKISIKDPTGILSAEIIQVNLVEHDQRVDLWGFLSVRNNRTVLADACFEVTRKAAGSNTNMARPNLVAATLLTSIGQVRSLSKGRANENLPARVRGVLTFVDPEWRVVFLQDEESAIFLDTDQSDLRTGQYVEVSGQTDGTGFAPQLIKCSTRILGTTNLPAPIRVELQDTASGHLDSHWVEMEGVIQKVSKANGRISLSLTGRAGRFSATVLDLNTNGAPTELIDSLVSLHGVCGSTVNSRSQLSGVHLHVPSLSELNIIDASPSDPFKRASIPISTVATFNPNGLAGRRIKISGVITLAVSGKDLYLQDASGGMRVLCTGTNEFRVGERLNVLGFPALKDFSPCLEEAAISPDGMTNLPAPRRTTASQILQDGSQDGLRVEIHAQVIQNYSRSAQARLLLQDGAIIFNAQMAQPHAQTTIPDLGVGCILSLRGVCIVQKDENNEPSGFRLLLASPKDLIVLKTAPWLTTTHALVLLGSMTIAAGLALMWGYLLKRQVYKQTEIIRRNQEQLLETSRFAGMAEIATNVLHNVGNVLNSVNISASIVSEKVKESPAVSGLSRAVALMDEHGADLGDFITNHPRGKNLPAFLKQLAERLRAENAMEVDELQALGHNIDHIKDIVAMQLTFARVGGNLEKIAPREIMEDALLINAGEFSRYGIELKRDYNPAVTGITADKHKLLQILVNLITNARNACMESAQPHRKITLGLDRGNGCVKFSVQDNGVGIAPENRARIFNHGFTTRKDGHGFGLHGGAIAAKQMGGQLTVQSDGPGCGACFTVELPVSQAVSPQKHNNQGNEKPCMTVST
jgi:signal transduction histidine kinase